jgi:hypothetical protein
MPTSSALSVTAGSTIAPVAPHVLGSSVRGTGLIVPEVPCRMPCY